VLDVPWVWAAVMSKDPPNRPGFGMSQTPPVVGTVIFSASSVS
jgi:hypothetical protein